MKKEPYAVKKHSKIRKLNLKQEDEIEKLKKKSRLISIKEGTAYSVSEGAGMKYITPYALSLGANNMHIGLLAALPTMLGNFSQLVTIKLMEKFSRKKISFVGAFIQAIMWLMLIALGIIYYEFPSFASATPSLLVAIYCILTVFGAFIVPAWVSWMGQLIHKDSYGHYFGMRNRIVGVMVILTMIISGFMLDYFKQTHVFIGFAILFFIAFIARLVSAFYFKKQYEPKLELHKGYYFSIWQFMARMTHNNFGLFVLFVSLLYLATFISSPFFSVYTLKHLQFSYVFYTIVMMAAPVATLIFVPAWGKFADRYGTMRTMKLCSYFTFLIPVLWLGSILLLNVNHLILLAYLVVIEAFSGFIWAGLNISISNFVFDAVTEDRVGLCTAYFNIFTGIGLFLGAALGGLISSANIAFLGLGAIFIGFIASAVLRLVVPVLMLHKLSEVRIVKDFNFHEAKRLIVNLSPNKIVHYLDLNMFRPKP